jgi:LuxR family maltose regulon positive regulatory protein
MPSSRRSSTEATPLEDRDTVDSDVDTADDLSLSFARPNPPSPSTPVDPDRAQRRPAIGVGPGRPPIVAPILDPRGLLGAMPEYPIQISKVQAPPLRDQTLARDRLLEWLAVKVHSRAVLVIAEAGYGKTTLLADFSRRTRIRTLWFRLDRGDRDWVGFIAYLVAAVRVHVSSFGAVTNSLLRETASSAPPRDAVLDTFLRELGDLPSDPTALIFDDFHLVDDAPDIRHVAIELIERAPERLSFVFASRRTPPVRIARLRALGEVAELGTADLRFDATETEKLFRETYEMRLEPAIIAELSRRTEGWAASLQLVRTAIHDRDPAQIRSFIRSLSGAEGHLYDYLAEEVVGDLPNELQQFLMCTSVLETIDLTLGPIAAEVPSRVASELIDEGERLGLFGRRGPQTRHQVRAHPLVREFLQARLLRSVGSEGVAEIHRRTARAAEPIDWRLAGHHYLAAGDFDDVRRVLASSIQKILATGAYRAAETLASGLADGHLGGSAGLVLTSRLAQQRGDSSAGLLLAEQARDQDPESTPVLLNLVTARTLAGDVTGALELGRLLEKAVQPEFAEIGRVYQRVIETSVHGSLDLAISELEALALALRARSEFHFLGVDYLNQAYLRVAMGEPEEALGCAEEAIALLESTSRGIELVSARLARASALAYSGDLDEARREIERAIAIAPRGQAIELAIEIGEIETLLGDSKRAAQILEPVQDLITPETDTGELALMVRSQLAIREGDLLGAASDIEQLRPGEPRTHMAFEVRRLLAAAQLAIFRGAPEAHSRAVEARAMAAAQGAWLWEQYASLLLAIATVGQDPSDALLRLGEENGTILSMAAEVVLLRHSELSAEAASVIATEARHRPWRWRHSLRRGLTDGPDAGLFERAQLLEEIGEIEDINLLRGLSRSLRDPRASHLGRDLTRRLAPKVFVEDLGRVQIVIGDRAIDGGEIRRRVLALLCLLISKTKFSSTREEVLESLWPELDPTSALNSLNQTVYFLRRVFEPRYREDVSPGYLLQDGETIWLDDGLVQARSQRCRERIRSIDPKPKPEEVVGLAEEYRGRFALDFAYEEWASAYRDSLHASYLRVMEQAIRMDIDAGQFARGIFLAERAAEIEPDSEEIQIALLRLYRLSGAHAAAAEQYTHYAHTLRELGVDPPPLAEI